MEAPMKREHIIRIVAGTLVLTGTALGYFADSFWLIIPAFVGVNLIQSAITKWCLMERILKKLNIGSEL